MKILLDEGVPHPLAHALTTHEFLTVADIGRNGVKNGKLLQIVEELNFDVFITADKNIPHQQELSQRRFAVLLLSTNDWPILRAHIEATSSAIDRAQSGSIIRVECGSFVPARRSGRTTR